MKTLQKLLIIVGITCLGELLGSWIKLPIPAGIYGMLLMLAGLALKIIPLQAVESTGKFLLDVMPVMFIPAAVGLLESWVDLKPILLPVVVITAVSTLAVMGVTGRVTQRLLRGKPGETEDGEP